MLCVRRFANKCLSNPASRRLGVQLCALLVPHETRCSVFNVGGAAPPRKMPF